MTSYGHAPDCGFRPVGGHLILLAPSQYVGYDSDGSRTASEMPANR
jgi:hypothetical protein